MARQTPQGPQVRATFAAYLKAMLTVPAASPAIPVQQPSNVEVILRLAAKILQVGKMLEDEAVFYLECAYDVQATKATALAAACLYLTIRQHQLPISLHSVLTAVEPNLKLTSELLLAVADACQLKVPIFNWTHFGIRSLSLMPGVDCWACCLSCQMCLKQAECQ